MKVSNIVKHFHMICKHKRWVGYYCFKMGIPWRGIKHDISKFSPVEFWEGVKYYKGTDSPINECKRVNGWSKAWQHHKGRNDHHYEYFVDDFDHGGRALIMPFNCMLEMFCDYLGAGHAYMGKNFTYLDEQKWWKNKKAAPLKIHPVTKNCITYGLAHCVAENKIPTRATMKEVYYNELKNYAQQFNILY